MRLYRFIGHFDLRGRGSFQISNKELINQLRNVLRLKTHDNFILSDGNLNEALVRIRSFKNESIDVEILESFENKNELQRDITLYLSILKKENFELALQKATEIGIKTIVPIISKRTVKFNINEDRILKIVKEAAEQSGRGILPFVEKSIEFDVALADNFMGYGTIFFDPSGEPINLEKLGTLKKSNKIGIWVGPEGGWEASEIQLAREKGFYICSFGNLIYRAETAAIIASCIISIV